MYGALSSKGLSQRLKAELTLDAYAAEADNSSKEVIQGGQLQNRRVPEMIPALFQAVSLHCYRETRWVLRCD
jgi:hypothetical protein